MLKNTLLKGEITPFVMEMPPYHLPTFRSVVLRAFERLQTFLLKAGRILIPVIMALSFLNSLGTDGSFGNENSENSVLASMSRIITPALTPLGVTEENWPATVGIFTGIFAKEAVVGTLDTLYAGMDRQTGTGVNEDEPVNLWAAVKAAFATIPANLAGVVDTFADPLGMSVGTIDDQAEAAEEQEVSAGTFGSMVRLFGSQSAAFAYMLFVLLYFPCSAAIAAVYRETNLAWTLFVGFWTTLLAFVAATLFYQGVNFAAHPGSSTMVIVLDLGVMLVVIGLLKALGRRKRVLRPVSITVRPQLDLVAKG